MNMAACHGFPPFQIVGPIDLEASSEDGKGARLFRRADGREKFV
jgi:hypothetical protein